MLNWRILPSQSLISFELRASRGTEVQLKAGENGGSELNVIGQTTDEAVDAVDKFLDEASLASLSQVRSFMATVPARCVARSRNC